MALDNPEFAAMIQPLPITNQHSMDVAVEAAKELRKMGLEDIAEDIEVRVRLGERKYGSRLKSHNGRNVWLDLMQELDDACNYAMQCQIEEKDDGSVFNVISRITAIVSSRYRNSKLDGYQELWILLLKSVDEVVSKQNAQKTKSSHNN